MSGPLVEALDGRPFLTRRAIARLVASMDDLTPLDAAWCSTFLAVMAADEGLPGGPREVLDRTCRVLEVLARDRRSARLAAATEGGEC